MQTVIIFFILFFSILMLLYPIIRVIYFLTSKKNKQNKILNLCIIISSFIIVFFIVRGSIKGIMSLDLGRYVNSRKWMILTIGTVFFGNIVETIVNSIINFFIKRRAKKVRG